MPRSGTTNGVTLPGGSRPPARWLTSEGSPRESRDSERRGVTTHFVLRGGQKKRETVWVATPHPEPLGGRSSNGMCFRWTGQYFKTLKTRVSVVYIETWASENKALLGRSQDIRLALRNFTDYLTRRPYKVVQDTTQLLSGETFAGGASGMAIPDSICTDRSIGISVDINPYEPHLVAAIMAHMIGHNIGMGHDNGRTLSFGCCCLFRFLNSIVAAVADAGEECHCSDWHGCIMSQSIVGLESVQPYKFSNCSLADYIGSMRSGRGICLLNRPNQVPFDLISLFFYFPFRG